MSRIAQVLDSISEKVEETKGNLVEYALADSEPPSEIETPALDSLLEEIKDIIDDRKTERQIERDRALYERRMAGDWS